jgi:hypothetical protein
MPTNEFDGLPNDLDEDDLIRLEQRLGDWSPSLGGLDRDRFLYEAGRADLAARDRRLFKALLAASIALALAAVGSGAAWRLEHDRNGRLEAELAQGRQEIRRLLAIQDRVAPPSHLAFQEPTDTPGPETPDPFSYLALSRRIAGGRIDFDRPERPAASNGDRPSRPHPAPLRVGDRDQLLDL